jgi:DNA-binding transcriptional LysR family regulator
VTQPGAAQLRNLSERRVDLLIFRKLGLFGEGQTTFEFLFESPYVVVAGLNNQWAKRRRIALADLMNELWVLPPSNDSFGPFVESAFRAAGLEVPRAAVVASAFEMCANLLKTGRYISIIPAFWLRYPNQNQLIKKLAVDLPMTGAPIGIITMKNRAPTPVVQRFIDGARQVAMPLTRRN